MEVDLTPNHLANEWWDNEGKQYQELIPGGHPKELSNGCVKKALIGKNYCESAEETTVYTCEGDTTWNVCLENRGNYYRVRGIGYGRRQLYNTRVYGIEGARALAYLVAEYRSHPDFTQKQLDPKVLNKVVRAKGIRVSHAANTALVRFGNRGAKSLSFLYSAFGKARADILASFAAVLQSKVVFSAIPAQESELRSPDPTQVAKKTNPYLSPMNSSVPTNTRANAVSTPCAWWDNEGKQYQELIPGGHPKELSNGCVKKALIGNNYCESAVETTVYTCEGDTTWNVCLENRENSYRVRGVGYGRCQLYNTRVYGIEGARALAYLTAEYRSHPDFTQKQLDPKVLNKVVRVRGIKVVHAVDRALVRFGNHGAKSVSFLYSAFGKARAEILASFAAVLQSKVVFSAIPAQESELRSPDPTQVAKKTNPYLSPMNSSVPTNTRANAVSTPCAHDPTSKITTHNTSMEVALTPNNLATECGMDNEGKQYQHLIPGGRPKELKGVCSEIVTFVNSFCLKFEEKAVYLCEGDSVLY
eukprot:Lankesteria_metandrocarpae@DN5462_c1_g1_i2.p1